VAHSIALPDEIAVHSGSPCSGDCGDSPLAQISRQMLGADAVMGATSQAFMLLKTVWMIGKNSRHWPGAWMTGCA